MFSSALIPKSLTRAVILSAELVLLGCSSAFALEPSLTPNLTQALSPSLNAEKAYSAIMEVPSIRQTFSSDTNTLKLAGQIHGNSMDTTKYQHYYKGIEVLGSMTMLHTGPNGSQIDDRLVRFDLDTSPAIKPEDAVTLVKTATGRMTVQEQPVLKILPSSEDSARLVYFFELKTHDLQPGAQIIIDAHSGEVIANIPAEENLAPIQVYSAQDLGKELSQTSLGKMSTPDQQSIETQECQVFDETGDPYWIDAKNCKICNPTLDPAISSVGNPIINPLGNPVDPPAPSLATRDASAQRAANYTQTTLQYYQNTFGRNSYDGNGSPLIGVVHAGKKYDNAFWNIQTQMMAYGDGDGTMFGDFTNSLDVIGHEITHGVTASTAKLLMVGESGSINEAFSDFFGRMIANDGQWSIGKTLFLNPASPGLRDLANPGSISYETKDKTGKITHSGVYPSNINEMLLPDEGEACDMQTNDNCFIHINSTIASHASYLVYQAIGKAMAEKLYFTTLTQKLTATSTMRTMAQAVVDTCSLTYDTGTCSKVIDAYGQVGIETQPGQVTPTQN
jgi:Zn-dependent metalloprotease